MECSSFAMGGVRQALRVRFVVLRACGSEEGAQARDARRTSAGGRQGGRRAGPIPLSSYAMSGTELGPAANRR
eukprot:1995624-Rhodomonas_salina.2